MRKKYGWVITYQGLGLIFPYMENRVIRVSKETMDYMLQSKWISLKNFEKGIRCSEDKMILNEKGCAVICCKGLRCIVWIGGKGVSIQMSKLEILHEKSLSKDIE